MGLLSTILKMDRVDKQADKILKKLSKVICDDKFTDDEKLEYLRQVELMSSILILNYRKSIYK